ncbi:MAG: response regulator [Desulforhabdus sp.]|nr:response regulator [Desulforhabdus sp.]
MISNILIVEDEQKIVALLRDYLEKANYRVSFLDRGDQVIAHVKKNPPDLILLDVMLPGMDGLEVCREIRKFSMVPIIMITARVEEIDRLIGLELGADDYVCKPFSPREVVARVKAVLRRFHSEPAGASLQVGPIALDVDSRQATVEGQLLELTPSEFGLLRVLMAHPNRVFSRNELLNQVQGYDFEGYDRTIDTHIKNLRKKIAGKLPDREIIATVYGVGYTFRIPADPE